MIVVTAVSLLISVVVGFPTLHRGCQVPSTPDGPHPSLQKSFDGTGFSFHVEDMDGGAVEAFTPGMKYKISVINSDDRFRMMFVGDSG